MKITNFKITQILLTVCFLASTIAVAQVGIGTDTPDTTSILDLQSSSKGLLVPRMSTLEREAIESPAESLLVFDTTEQAFYYYSTTNTSWTMLENDTSVKRDNFKLIKSVTDLAPELTAGSGTTYKLDENTYYEINGTIALAFPIDLNNAYISGLDANEDILVASGVVFKGSTGGSIRNLTIKGTKAFEITGPGIATNSSLLVQNTVVDGMTSSVGSISGFGIYFGNIIQFINNADGITYSNIGNLLLNNQAWFSSNNGTFEKLTGSFGLVEKVSGFSTVNGSDIAFDVSTTGLAVGNGVLNGTVFSGTTTAPDYIKGYTTDSYIGYSFTTAWSVNAPGIPKESDGDATGDINLSAVVGSGETTSFTGTGTSSRRKVVGTTTSNNLFRFTKNGDNRITYRGNQKRYFQVVGSVSYQSLNDIILIVYIAKNGVIINETKVYTRATNDNSISAVPVVGTIEMKKDDYIEIWAERFSGTGNMLTVSLNLSAR